MPYNLDLNLGSHGINAPTVCAFVLHCLGVDEGEGSGVEAAAFRASHFDASQSPRGYGQAGSSNW